VPVSIEYDGIRFDEGFRADLIVENKVILELKSVEKVIAAHKKQIQTYLRRFYPRFELFAEKGAFFQVDYCAEFDDKKVPWMSLAAETATGNNPVFFSHTWDEAPRPLSATETARLMVANQTFALSGGRSPLGLKNRADSPAAKGLVVLAKGENLLQTLAYNLLDYPQTNQNRDIPIWEQEPITLDTLKQAQLQPVMGHVQRYTWLSRLVYLFPEGPEDAPVVVYMTYASGHIINASEGPDIDPMIPYRIDEKKGYIPIRPRQERALWRDYPALVPMEREGILHSQTAVRGKAIWERHDGRAPYRVSVFTQGRVPGKAKLEFWQTALFPVPDRILKGKSFQDVVFEIEELATDVEKVLREKGWTLAREILSVGQSSPASEDVNALISTLPLTQVYWPKLERSFHELLECASRGDDEEELLQFWVKALESAAKQAWNTTVRSVGTQARALRAVSKISPGFYGTLKRVVKPKSP
jgi:CRISPR system Cascade subunit CasA